MRTLQSWLCCSLQLQQSQAGPEQGHQEQGQPLFAACSGACICSKQLEGAWPVALQQINLRIEQELLKQMKAEAKQRGLSLNLLAASAFEKFLAGGGAAEPSSNKLEGLADVLRRLQVLEQKLAKQEQQQAHHLPHGPAPTAVKPPAEAKPAPPPQLGDGAISTADLATATGTNRAGWNNWARDKEPGAIRKMKGDVGHWRYLGKFPSELGGPDRGMWQPV